MYTSTSKNFSGITVTVWKCNKHVLLQRLSSPPMCSSRSSSLCKYKKITKTRSAWHRLSSIQLLNLVFMYLLFSSFMLNQAVTAAACSSCPSECSCTSEPGNQCYVDCSGRNLNSFPSGLDSSVKKLDLSNNNIEAIPETFFNGFSSLEELSLHNNNLNSLTNYVFQQLTNLNNVTLSGNNWTCTCDIEWLQQLVKGEGEFITGINVHDKNQIVCSSPSSLLHQSLKDVDLSTVKCASSYISCLHHSNGTNTVILWQYTDLESSITEDVECKKQCLISGYSYAVVHTTESMCLCSSGTLPQSIGSTCDDVCSDTVSTDVCGRQVVNNNVLLASISFRIDGLRTYSQHEAIQLSVTPDFKVESCPNFIWNFNDSTVVIVTEKFDVMHKYALAGSYYVTITVNCKNVYDSYSIMVNVEEPIGDVSLQCNKVIELGESINATVDVQHGSQPRLMWKSSLNGTVEYDETFLPTGSSFLESLQIGYILKTGPQNLMNAQASCQENQGNLVVVDSSTISDYLQNNLIVDAVASGNKLFWIGVVIDDVLGGTIFHVTQQSVSGSMFSNWAVDQPNLGDASARCVALNATDGGKWYTLPCTDSLPYICQYRSPDIAEEPHHYISGSTLFGSSTTSALENLVESAPTSISASEKVYTLLFPGLWVYHAGTSTSWEFSGSSTSVTAIRLQIFRPVCASGSQLIRPGCSSFGNSYSTCGSAVEFNTCIKKITPCESGQQLCPITNSCKELSEPCSHYAENVTSSIPTAGIPSYKLVGEYVVSSSLNNNKIYQLIAQNGEELKMDDVIGIAFSHSITDHNSIQLTDLPLLCQSTNLSLWRQNAMLVQTDSWTTKNSNLDTSTNNWIESVWCDIRMHYSHRSTGSIPSSTFLTPSEAGNLTFIVQAFNNVSQSDSSSCNVEVRDLVKSAKLISPPSTGTSPEGYPIIAVEAGTTAKIILEIEGGGSNVETQFEGIEGRSGLLSECPSEIIKTYTECTTKSTGNLRITATDIPITANSSLITATVSNAYSSTGITIRVTTEIAITGLRILPAATTRVLASIPQVFTAEVDTGTNIVYSWVVDDLTQFIYTNQQYNVLFRTPAVYVLSVQATNGLGLMNTSVTLTVDEMNRLSSLQFVDAPSPFIAETGADIEIKAKFLVDININYQIEWTINNVAETGAVINQPHMGDPDPDPDIERVYGTDSKNASFPTTGEKSIKIKVFNEYDSISETITVDIRSLLTGVVIEMTSNVPAVGDDLQFRVSGSPSTYGAVFTYDWGDGTTDPDSNQGTITHRYSSPGTYTVNMTADNKLNAMSNTTMITIYERVTGLTLTSDGPTEISTSTVLTADIVTGKASALFSFDFDSLPSTDNVTDLSYTVIYPSLGRYNVSVTATNPISSEQKFLEVHVFAIDVTNVNTTEGCFKTNGNATMQAFMPTDVTTLFDYEWIFQDGTSIDVDSNNTINHVFTTAGYHNVTARVKSKKTSKYDEMSVIVCIEDEITSAAITDSPETEIGSSTTFKLNSVGGTNPVYKIDFGDGTLVENITLADITHTYSSTGNYTVTFTAKNLVSEVTDIAYAVVQEAVQGINISTSSTYSPLIAKDLQVLYTATSTNGTDLEYQWDFKDGSALQSGIEANHTYSTTGDFKITLTVSNLISSKTFDFDITVKEPVTGASITGQGSIIRANTSVTFTASISTGGPGENYYWKVTPGHDYTLSTSTFTYVFTDIKNYSISVKIENEVSADYAEIFALAADLILGVNISTDALVDGKYTARNEITRFEALLDSGENISTTTAGSSSAVTSDWTISINGVTEEVYNDSSIIFHSFKEVGIYTVSVNVSNGVSSKQSEITVDSIDRIGDINFMVIDGFDGAAATGSEVKIMAIVSVGTNLEFFWDPNDSGAAYAEVNDTNLTYTYSAAGKYYPFVRVENPLGNKTESYDLTVQDVVTGLEITHMNAIVPFNVPLSQQTHFVASISSGTDVIYSWYYVGESGTLSDIENSTNTQMNWKFPEVTTYKLIVNASNLVSWDQVNYTVTVVTPISNLDIVSDSLLVATNATVKIKGTVEHGDNVNFKFYVNGSELLAAVVNEKESETSSYFVSPGIYEVYVEASNNVSSSNLTKIITVRDPISGVKIEGCCTDAMYVATGENLTFSVKTDSGTDIVYSWNITYETGQVIQASGQEIHKTLTVPGRTEVKLLANNGVSESIIALTLQLQDKCLVQLSVENPGRTQYINENITLNINVVVGTNVSHTIDWGDFPSIPDITTASTAVHIYRFKNDYTITVNTSNQVSWVENTASVTISKLACVAPTISFVESSKSSKFFRSRTIYVESTITTNCSDYDVSYTWLVYKQEDCTTLNPNNVQKISVGSNKPMLVLPALTLEVSNYCFEVEVSYDDTYLSDKSAVSVAVLSTPLTVVIIGGTTRFLSKGAPLVLDAGYSFDPDVPSEQQKGLSFLWTCNSSNALTEEDYGYINSTVTKTAQCDIPLAYQTEYQFSIPPETLEEEMQYDYKVTASKTGKTDSSAVQRVVVVPRTIPTTTIVCYTCYSMASYQISASFHVGLQGSCDTCSSTDNIKYIWEVLRVSDNGSEEDTIFPLDLETTTTGAQSRYLVVKEGALVNSYTYQFKLRINVDGEEGYSKLVLGPNLPPLNGTCVMTYDGWPTNPIYALDTLVSFSCSNWRDDAADSDSPLVYTIVACRRSSTGFEDTDDTFILYRGTQLSYEGYVPLGHADYGYLVNIKVLVEDQLGTSTLGLDQNVTVTMGERDSHIDWLVQKIQVELTILEKLNDPQDILDFSAAAITILNSVSAQNNISVADTEYSKRVAVREKITQTVTGIETTTLKEVQQVASVLEQCMKEPMEMQNPSIQQNVVASVENMVTRLGEFVNKEGQTTFQRATNDVLDIIGGLIRVVNYAVYDTVTAETIANPNAGNVSVNYTEEYRREIVNKLMTNIDLLVENVLKSKVVDEEAVSFLSPVVSVTSIKTTPSTAPKEQVNGGIYWNLPSHVFDGLSSDIEMFAVSMVYEQNPFTYGFPPHSLSSNGYANITSRVPRIEYTYPNGTAIPITNLATASEGNERRVKLVMAQSSWEYLSVADTLQVVNASGSNYQPRAGLVFESTPDMVEPLQSVAITIKNDNRDAGTAVHIMIIYTKKYNNNKAEPNPTIEAYFGYSPKPNKEDYAAILRISDVEMTDGANHQLYTFFLDPSLNDTTVPELYLNISNYFTYEIIDLKIAVYYSLCLYYGESSDIWATDGLYPSSESTYTVSVCYSDHLTSFGSFVINPPNLINVTDIVNIDFSQNPIALITVVVIMFLYIVAMIWARKLDLRDIKKASVIPLCGLDGSFKYEITIKTAAGIGSGTTANVGICVYGYDTRSGSRHLARKDAFQRGAVDTMQIASDVSLGEIYKIKLWHDNTGLDPGWCVDRVMVRDLQTEYKYYFLVNSWLQVYPDDEDETCLEKTIRVATEEELMNFSNIFGSQLSYGWEDAHLWLSVIERPTRSRFTRVQRVTCCVTLLLTFMLFSAFWYQGWDADGDVIPQDTIVGILRWKDIAVGAIVSLMVFPLSLIIVCVFKKSKSKVAPVKPWLERSRTAQTIEILDEIIDGNGRRYNADMSDSDDDYSEGSSRHHQGLPGQNEFLAGYFNESVDGGSLFHSRAQTPVSIKSKPYESSSSRKAKLHKGSGTVKSLDIKDKVWSDDSAIQLSDSPSSSGVTGSSGDIASSSEDRSSTSGSPDWPNRTNATKKGLLHSQNENQLQKPVKFSTTQFTESPQSVTRKPLRRRNTGFVRNTDSASPPNFVPENEDDDEDINDLWDVFANNDDMEEDLVITNKQAVLKRTRGTKFNEIDEIPLGDEHRGLVLDDVLVSHSDDDSDESDVPLPDFPTSRGESRMSRASTYFGSSPQPSSEKYLLPHWCIYLNYFICFITMGVCILFIILYGNAFGADTTKRWLLSMFVALLESFFIVEPIKVVLFAAFLALITKPINPDENDNLVDEPLVEAYGHTDSFSKVRAPGGFALDKCKREAQKTKRSNKLLLHLAIYLIFLSSVAAVASWDRDTMGYYNTLAVKKSLFNTEFRLQSDAEGPRWQNKSSTFNEIRTVTDIWAWLDQIFAVKIYEAKTSLENENLNNNLLGKVRLRQQRDVPGICFVDTGQRQYSQITNTGQTCLNHDSGKQETDTFGVGWTNSTNDSWTWTKAEFGGVMYWGEDLIYDDSGYSQFINSSSTETEAKQKFTELQDQNWIDRNTRVVFVEFTQLNPATYWFTVCAVMFEIGVSGGVRPSIDIQTVRIVVPSSSFYVDMLFMSFVGIIGIILLVMELKKVRDPKITPQLYFTKWTNWVNLVVLALTLTLCILFIYKEIYMEEVTQRYISDKTAFTNFYKIAFYTDLVTITACLLLFAIIARAARLLRFIKSWSSIGDTIVASAGYLLGASFMLMLFVLNFAILGYLVYGQSYNQVISDFRDFPNAIYAMFRAFRGRLDVRTCFDYSPFFTIFFFFSYFFGIFYIFCRIFAAILINEYKFSHGRKSHLRTDVPDYEILKHLIARIKMRLGIIKPKQYRPMVRFEGMSTPSSRGSFMSLDSFDTCFMPGRISQCSYATGISSSSSDSGFGTPSDHSISVYDYLTLDQPSDTPMDNQHLDYLYNRLSNYSVDMMLHRFERVNVLTNEVTDMESEALEITQRKKQLAMLQSQAREIATAASSMTVQPHFIPASESKGSVRSAATYSSRGHFSMHSQQTLSQTSLNSGRKSEISNDSRFQTVMQSMFPDVGDPLRRPPVRSSSYTGPSQTQKGTVRGTISASSVLKKDEDPTGKWGIAVHNSTKKRPHSDEGVRFSTDSTLLAQEKHSRASLNDLNTRYIKQSSGRSGSPHPQKIDSKGTKHRPSPLGRTPKKSAWQLQ
uniref:polycystin-1-like n=1 Tax=Styela clava TaxID=7725 RepID=UPI001939A0BB|nr:polycystin-1-like [Styela clava]